MSKDKKPITGDPEIDRVLNDVGEGLQELFGEVKKAGKKAVDDAKQALNDQVPIPPVNLNDVLKQAQRAAEDVVKAVKEAAVPKEEPEEKDSDPGCSMPGLDEILSTGFLKKCPPALREEFGDIIYEDFMDDVKPIIDMLPGIADRLSKDMTPAAVALAKLMHGVMSDEEVRKSVREVNEIDATIAMERYTAFKKAGFTAKQAFILTAGKEPMTRQIMMAVSDAAESAGKSAGSSKKDGGPSKKSAAGKTERTSSRPKAKAPKATVTKRKVRVTTPKGDKKK